ncbi:MAG: tetratricopeptide repeat protein, partial [Azoarcus sp.]|nr:tetratricopeptide repeat protein [Azoarcus sp.]
MDSTIIGAIIMAVGAIVAAALSIWYQKRSKDGAVPKNTDEPVPNNNNNSGGQNSNGGSGNNQVYVGGDVGGSVTTGNTINSNNTTNTTNIINNYITNITNNYIIQLISQETGVPLAALRGILASMGETALAEASPEKIEQLLRTKAEEYLALQKQLQRFTGNDPEVDRLRKAAKQALQEGRLQDARDLLRRARQRVHEAGQPQRQEEASLAAEEAETAKLQPNPASYREAADLFGEAVALIATDDAPQANEYRLRQASVIGDLGREFGDNDALLEAIVLYRQILSRIDRAVAPLDWAATQNNLGVALWTLGERESGTARLEEAVAAYREALEERTRERVPLDWAGTQNNLGNVLSSLGERESGTARLEEAVAAYREAQKEYTRERVPLDWAMTQNNLGTAL